MPKSLYRTAEELENEDLKLWTETIYQSASVFKGAPHEVRPPGRAGVWVPPLPRGVSVGLPAAVRLEPSLGWALSSGLVDRHLGVERSWPEARS